MPSNTINYKRLLPHEGTISRILKDGFCYVRDDNGSVYVFPFNTIIDYAGQSVKELKLKTGTRVSFNRENDRIVAVAIKKDWSNSCKEEKY